MVPHASRRRFSRSFFALVCCFLVCIVLALAGGDSQTSQPYTSSSNGQRGNPNASEIFIVSTLDGQLTGYNAQTGQLLWSFNTGGPLVDIDSVALKHRLDTASGIGAPRPSSSISSFLPGLNGELYLLLHEVDSAERSRSVAKPLGVSVADIVTKSPFALPQAGGIFLGSKTNVHFVVDPLSGAITASRSAGSTGAHDVVKYIPQSQLLDVVRTDYIVQNAADDEAREEDGRDSGATVSEDESILRSKTTSNSDGYISIAKILLRPRGQAVSNADATPQEERKTGSPAIVTLSRSGLSLEAYHPTTRQFLWRRQLLSPPSTIYLFQQHQQSQEGAIATQPQLTKVLELTSYLPSAHQNGMAGIISPRIQRRAERTVHAQAPMEVPRYTDEVNADTNRDDGMVFVTEYDDTLEDEQTDDSSANLGLINLESDLRSKNAESQSRGCTWSGSNVGTKEYPQCLVEVYETARLASQLLAHVTPPPKPKTLTRMPPALDDAMSTKSASGLAHNQLPVGKRANSSAALQVAVFVPTRNSAGSSSSPSPIESIVDATSHVVSQLVLDAYSEPILARVFPLDADTAPSGSASEDVSDSSAASRPEPSDALVPLAYQEQTLEEMLENLRKWATYSKQSNRGSSQDSKSLVPMAVQTADLVENAPKEISAIEVRGGKPDSSAIAARTAAEILKQAKLPASTEISVTTSVTTVTIRSGSGGAKERHRSQGNDDDDDVRSGSVVHTSLEVDRHDSGDGDEDEDEYDDYESERDEESTHSHRHHRHHRHPRDQPSEAPGFLWSVTSLLYQLFVLLFELITLFVVHIRFSVYVLIVLCVYYMYYRKLHDNEQLYAVLQQQSKHSLSLLSMTPKLTPASFTQIPQASILGTLIESKAQVENIDPSNHQQSKSELRQAKDDPIPSLELQTDTGLQLDIEKLRSSPSSVSEPVTASSSQATTASLSSSLNIADVSGAATTECTADPSRQIANAPQTASTNQSLKVSAGQSDESNTRILPLTPLETAASEPAALQPGSNQTTALIVYPKSAGASPAPTSTAFAYPLQTEESRFRSMFVIPDLAPLGQGAFGIVRVCFHRIDGEAYAIKQMRLWEKEERANELLLREVRALARLDHPNVIRYYNAWFEWLTDEHDLWRTVNQRKNKGSKMQVSIVGDETYTENTLDGDEDEDEDSEDDEFATIRKHEELYALSATCDRQPKSDTRSLQDLDTSLIIFEKPSQENEDDEDEDKSEGDDKDQDEDEDDDWDASLGSLDMSHSTAFAQAGFTDPFMNFSSHLTKLKTKPVKEQAGRPKPSAQEQASETEDESDQSSTAHADLSRAQSELSLDDSIVAFVPGDRLEAGDGSESGSSSAASDVDQEFSVGKASTKRTTQNKSLPKLNRVDSTTILRLQPLQVQELHAVVNAKTGPTPNSEPKDPVETRAAIEKRVEEEKCVEHEREETARRLRERKGRPILLYIQMQYCKGGTLADWLRNPARQIDVIENIVIFEQIANGIAHVHKKGLMHRDLKPENIFFFDKNHVRIGDFGLSVDRSQEDSDASPLTKGRSHNPKPRFADARRGHVHTNGVGSPLYSAPEQMEAKNHYDERADIFSLGIIFFEMHHKFSTVMERVIALTNARAGKIQPSEYMSQDAVDFCVQLVKPNPKERPSAEQVLTNPWLRAMRSKGPHILY